ncbi:hypothetical protein HaLaN_27891, partial [Haematococcus lacustris]
MRAKWIMSIVLPVVLGSLFAAAVVTLLQRRRSWRMAQEAAAAKIGSYYNGPHAGAGGSMGEGGPGSMLEGMGVGRGGLVNAWEPAAPSLLSAPLTMQGTEDAMSMRNVHNSHACVDMGVNSAGGSSLQPANLHGS